MSGVATHVFDRFLEATRNADFRFEKTAIGHNASGKISEVSLMVMTSDSRGYKHIIEHKGSTPLGILEAFLDNSANQQVYKKD